LSEIAAELRGLSVELSELCAAHKELGPASERLDKLERERFRFEAECQGLLLAAEGKRKAAMNAEARERVMKKSYETHVDPFDEAGDGPEAPAGDPDIEHDVAAGEAEGVQPLRLDVAPSGKALAVRRKFGING